MMLSLSFLPFFLDKKVDHPSANSGTVLVKSSFSFRTKASLNCLENEYFALPLDRLRAIDFRFGVKFNEALHSRVSKSRLKDDLHLELAKS